MPIANIFIYSVPEISFKETTLQKLKVCYCCTIKIQELQSSLKQLCINYSTKNITYLCTYLLYFTLLYSLTDSTVQNI